MNAKTKLQKLKVWTLTVSMAITLCLTAFPMTAYAQPASITMLYLNSTPNTLSGYDYTFTVGETIHLCFQCQPSPNLIVGDPSVTAGTLPSGLYIGDVHPGSCQFFVMGTCSDVTNGAVSVTLSATTSNNGTGTRAITITVNKASPTISGSSTLSGTAGYFGDLTATTTITNGWFGGSTPGMALVATITDGTHTATATATATAASVKFVFPAAQLNTLVVGGPYDIIVSAFAGNDNNNGFAAQKIGELTVKYVAPPSGGGTADKAASTVILSATGGTYTDNSITLTATVGAGVQGQAYKPAPTGTVTFREGDTTLAVKTLNRNGTATFTIASPIDEGSYTFTAEYSGDDNYEDAVSDPCTVDVTAFLSVSSPSLHFDAQGGTQQILLACNSVWSLDNSASWLTIAVSDFKADNPNLILDVTAEANPEATERKALLTLSLPGVMIKAVSVTQDAGVNPATALKATGAPSVIVYSQGGNAVVKSDTPIRSVAVYDIAGKLLKQVRNGSNLVEINGLPRQQVLIVRVTDGSYKLRIEN